MSPLSVFTYYIRNRRRALPVLAILALAVFGITLGVMLTGNIQEQAKMDLAIYQRFITVRPNWLEGYSTLKLFLKMELRSLPSLEALHTAIEFSTYLPLVVGGTTRAVVFAVEEDVVPYLIRRCDLVLKEGRLPRRNANELAIHEGVAKLRGLSLGSELSHELDERDWIRGRWKRVFGWRTISYTLPIPLMVGLFSISTVVRQPLRLDPIAIIERRD